MSEIKFPSSEEINAQQLNNRPVENITRYT